jgi:hypothetical protein
MMNDPEKLEALDAFHVTVNGVWAEVIAGRLSDDDGWAAIGDALADRRGSDDVLCARRRPSRSRSRR